MKGNTKIFGGLCVSILFVLSLTLAVSAAGHAGEYTKDNIQTHYKSKIIGPTNDGKDWIVQTDVIHPAGKNGAKDNNAKGGRGKGGKSKGGGKCYKLTGSNWKGQLPVNYVINPANPQGLSETFVDNAISTSSETWDYATSQELFNDVYTVDYTAKWGDYDGKNAYSFGDYDDGVIAVTRYWYTLYGGNMLEYDVLFNTKYAWGDAAVDGSVMDLQNIATHETGHGVGLDDLYNKPCGKETMYGYSWYGDVDKRTLETGDVNGLNAIYGS